MRKAWVVSAVVLALLCWAGGTLAAQEETRAPRLFFGPRLGVSAVVQDPAAFDAGMQVLFPDSSKSYFPVFTEMGLQAQQLVPLGDSKNFLSFQEMLLVGGCALGAAFASMPLHSVLSAFKSFKKMLFSKDVHIEHLIKEMVQYAETARRAQLPFVAVLTGVTGKRAFIDYQPLAVLESLAQLPTFLNCRAPKAT